jgi:hypothetical protein
MPPFSALPDDQNRCVVLCPAMTPAARLSDELRLLLVSDLGAFANSQKAIWVDETDAPPGKVTGLQVSIQSVEDVKRDVVLNKGQKFADQWVIVTLVNFDRGHSAKSAIDKIRLAYTCQPPVYVAKTSTTFERCSIKVWVPDFI